MSNGDWKANLGISFVLIAILVILVFIIVFAGVYMSRKYALSAETKMRFEELKE